MNYQEYRAAKESFLESNPLRLDCMNTQKALSEFVPLAITPRKEYTFTEAISAWQNATRLNLENRQVITDCGIRSLLSNLFEMFKLNQMTIILPKDVYPVYAQLLKEYPYQQYQTIPDLNLEFLDERNDQTAAMLLTLPLMPLGRYLKRKEVSTIMNWLATDQSRLLIIDAAYAFEKDYRIYEQFIRTDQCICLFSLSKPWLMPSQFGMAVGANKLIELYFQQQIELTTDWVGTFCEHLALPQKLQSVFFAEWNRLSASINAFQPNWQPPEVGYFSTVNFTFDQLLKEYNVLGVPASVFGSDCSDVTVISCLFDIQSMLMEFFK
ncbi:aminotransferase class I/II-fold pyridoxal phosphate-dependent enzyme [Gimesia aquarii]|uniref:Histidinol-phosphate aminotransferase n=1 Tax=Gimesia aquarii TaxID=2527964 RepID=A0A517W209_9PLAN|nr:aminotransferase class I/II-fold pyridoxal phosphate-dependent enzyme [Gimesia aquarii]QDT99303.1 histidinol-phosphate aminotransferase [Gimesia aquarii]